MTEFKNAFLTIDDSPGPHTDALVDFLVQRNVPAILFVRGALMDPDAGATEGFDKIVRAIKNGMVIGNHSYAHDRTSAVGFESQTQQILKTQSLIDQAYEVAGHPLPPRYIRFPHLDRGAGNAWVIDFETVPEPDRKQVQHMFWDGVRLENTSPPSAENLALKAEMQAWLQQQGFQRFHPGAVTLPWFQQSEMAQAIDVLITFSTSDWMLTPRHTGKWPYKTIEDLKMKIDQDQWLKDSSTAHIILAHDDREDSLAVTTALVDHFLNTGFRFLKI